MAKLTPMSLDEGQAIGSVFGLEVVEVEALLAGSVNSNFRLGLEGGGRAFLRVYEEQGREGAAAEAAMVEALAKAGVPTPRPLRRRDGKGALAEHAGKPVAVLPWIEGVSLCRREVTPEVTRRVGEALGRLHRAGAGLPDAPESRFGLAALARRIEGIAGREMAASLRADVAMLEERLARLQEEEARLGPGPEVVIHGDVFRDNVLWAGGEIAALLDFESASRGSAGFDLVVTVLAWCFGDALDEGLARAMGAGYAAARGLGREERARLFHDAQVAALRFAITRITDFELAPAGRMYRDYRRYLLRWDAIERLGPEGLGRLLLAQDEGQDKGLAEA